MPAWHTLSTSESLRQLNSDPGHGLEADEAGRRLAARGPNELREAGGLNPARILWEQLTATMVLILIGAAVLSAALGAYKDSLAIGAIVILYSLLGFTQEYRAERAAAALKKLAVPNARAWRGGALRELPARDLVPGDVIQVEAGNRIPADCRVIESASLRVDEAILTGESEPAAKHTGALSGNDLPLGDRRNLLYMGTTAVYGRGRAVVTETGMDTVLGGIAADVGAARHELTPLQRRLDRLGRGLAVVGFGAAGLLFVLGLLRGEAPAALLLSAVSVAVAIVPEGLPAVVTITLALGAQRMLKRRVLIRKLPAVETLGSVTVICSDKTGTLTENRMTVTALDVAGRRAGPRDGDLSASLRLLLAGGALCNDSRPGPDGGLLGDPTETALTAAAQDAGLGGEALAAAAPRAAEAPFDSDRKRMTTVHRLERPEALRLAGLPAGGYLAFTKGSVDGLLAIATHVWNDGRAEELDEAWRARIEAANRELASEGRRVLGLAFKSLEAPTADPAALESGQTFVGLFGLIDPARPEARAAVDVCRTAGIRPVMITGDHPLTGAAIAGGLGILGDSQALTGPELERMTDAELGQAVENVPVYARVSPEHKLRIVRALQARGHVVAMTGDGVNDAPALKQADIGVAMGAAGTDVAREASDMILLDDNFASIVAAVEEGRTIYDNVRKFIKFSVAGNLGKVLVMLLAPFLGKPVPLLPLQLLWLNLLTDGLLGLGLGLEPAEPGAMRRPPQSPRSGIFSNGLALQTAWVGALIGGLGLAVGAWYYFSGLPQWQTMIFTTLTFAQVWQGLSSRSFRESVLDPALRPNPALLGLAGLTVLLQLAVIYVPFLQDVFQTKPLSAFDLGLACGTGGLVFAGLEIEKLWLRRKS